MVSQQNTNLPSILKDDDIFASFNQIQESIRERAYSIFHNRDSNSADAISDWLNAESEVLSDVDLTLKDDKEQVTIEGNINEFLPDDIEIKAQDGKFMVCGIHTEKSSSKEKGVTRKTSMQKSFSRIFTLPDSVDTENMEVEVKSGKFMAKMPKMAQ